MKQELRMFSKELLLTSHKKEKEVLMLLGEVFQPTIFAKDDLIQGSYNGINFKGTISRYTYAVGPFWSNIETTIKSNDEACEIITKVSFNKLYLFQYLLLTVFLLVGAFFSISKDLLHIFMLSILIPLASLPYFLYLFLNNANFEKAIKLIKKGLDMSN